MSRIAIIAAMPGELKPLVRRWERRGRNAWAGRIGDSEAFAIAGGMGAAAARRAAERAIAEFHPDTLVSYGWTGALTCAVKPRAVCVISEVVENRTGERFATEHPEGYRLITLDHVARADEKRKLAQKHQAVLVDMEAAEVARAAGKRNLRFYCIKGVSDGYLDRLPDFTLFINNKGELRMLPFLAHVAVRPQYWPSLKRLGRNSSAAASTLSSFIQQAFKQSS